MEISDADLAYFTSLEYEEVCSALNLDGQFDDNMDSGNGANMATRNDLHLPEEMSDLHIANQSTDEQIAEAIRISMHDIPSPLDGVMSTPQGEETGDRYHFNMSQVFLKPNVLLRACSVKKQPSNGVTQKNNPVIPSCQQLHND